MKAWAQPSSTLSHELSSWSTVDSAHKDRCDEAGETIPLGRQPCNPPAPVPEENVRDLELEAGQVHLTVSRSENWQIHDQASSGVLSDHLR
jgi:hypothetical protein